jgi:ATP dependent DNA ligase domain
MVFDLLYLDGASLTGQRYGQRRAVLEDLFAAGRARPPLNLCPSTTDEAVARSWLEQWAPDHIEGLVLKPVAGTYRPGRRGGRGGWRKWRVRESREAVVGAVTGNVDRPGTVLEDPSSVLRRATCHFAGASGNRAYAAGRCGGTRAGTIFQTQPMLRWFYQAR